MSTVFLLLGSNLGDRLAHLSEARQEISRHAGKIITTSSIFQTAPWGDVHQPDFYNQAIEINPVLTPLETLHTVLAIEKSMGRLRFGKWGSRTIDIDIILWGNDCIHMPGLDIPHPHMQTRRFVLTPLTEIAPDAVHPVLHKTMQQLLAECPDNLAVKKAEL